MLESIRARPGESWLKFEVLTYGMTNWASDFNVKLVTGLTLEGDFKCHAKTATSYF